MWGSITRQSLLLLLPIVRSSLHWFRERLLAILTKNDLRTIHCAYNWIDLRLSYQAFSERQGWQDINTRLVTLQSCTGDYVKQSPNAIWKLRTGHSVRGMDVRRLAGYDTEFDSMEQHTWAVVKDIAMLEAKYTATAHRAAPWLLVQASRTPLYYVRTIHDYLSARASEGRRAK